MRAAHDGGTNLAFSVDTCTASDYERWMVPPPPTDDRAAAAAGEDLYGLDELLAIAGKRLGEEISPRTVRLYATQGLIDRPGRDGRHAVYGRRHLLQLLLIRSLARRGLSLSAIAPLCVLPDAEIEQQLGDLESGDPEASERQRLRQPALDYLQSLRGTRASTPEAPGLQQEIDGERSPVESTRSLLGMLGAPISPFVAAGSAVPSSPASREASSRWHRFTLTPGVELHISDTVVMPPAGSRRRQWLRKLADRLISLLDAEDP